MMIAPSDHQTAWELDYELRTGELPPFGYYEHLDAGGLFDLDEPDHEDEEEVPAAVVHAAAFIASAASVLYGYAGDVDLPVLLSALDELVASLSREVTR